MKVPRDKRIAKVGRPLLRASAASAAQPPPKARRAGGATAATDAAARVATNPDFQLGASDILKLPRQRLIALPVKKIYKLFGAHREWVWGRATVADRIAAFQRLEGAIRQWIRPDSDTCTASKSGHFSPHDMATLTTFLQLYLAALDPAPGLAPAALIAKIQDTIATSGLELLAFSEARENPWAVVERAKELYGTSHEVEPTWGVAMNTAKREKRDPPAGAAGSPKTRNRNRRNGGGRGGGGGGGKKGRGDGKKGGGDGSG